MLYFATENLGGKEGGDSFLPEAYALPSCPDGLGRASGYCLGPRAQLNRLMWA